MNTVYFDPPFSDEERRQRLYEGQLIVLSPTKSSLAFCKFARELAEEAFAPLNPETAQFDLPVEKYAEILQKLKPTFIHHPESKRYLSAILEDCGCDLAKTYYEVPKLRSSTSNDYLTKGIAFAWHPHRDTWFAALPSQINWWIPVYQLKSDNAMTFYPQYWNTPVKNSSKGYNYYKWNAQHRGGHVSQYIKEDPRPVPKATEPVKLEPEDPAPSPGGRHDPILGGASACQRTQHIRRDALQLRLQDYPSRRCRRQARGTEHRLGMRGPHARGLYPGDGSCPCSGRIFRSL